MRFDQIDLLRQTVARHLPAIRDLRHRLHTEPEIHFQEFKTREKLAKALADSKLAMWEPLLKTDLIGELTGKDDRTICLRADIDALPIAEQTGVSYASKTPGMMHACGHDGHMSMLVGAALVLSELQDLLPVNVRFVFQPAEEMVAGGKELVALGACDGTETAFALHGGPGRPVGTVCSLPGTFMAAADFFEVKVSGKGGHAAMPHLAVNPISAASRIVTEFHALHDRIRADKGSVLTVACMHAGDASNVIPDDATIQGTIRFLDAADGPAIRDGIAQILAAVEADMGVTTEVTYRGAYTLPVNNAPQCVDYLREVVSENLSPDVWRDEPEAVMTSEDFAFYLKDRPGVMFWLGLGETQPPLHNPGFDFNDDALENGILTFCLIALNYTQDLRSPLS